MLCSTGSYNSPALRSGAVLPLVAGSGRGSVSPFPPASTRTTRGTPSAMSKLSKPFRFATEGATCDGRTISRQDIVDMAATYVPATYTANSNLEHIRGYPVGDAENRASLLDLIASYLKR